MTVWHAPIDTHERWNAHTAHTFFTSSGRLRSVARHAFVPGVCDRTMIRHPAYALREVDTCHSSLLLARCVSRVGVDGAARIALKTRASHCLHRFNWDSGQPSIAKSNKRRTKAHVLKLRISRSGSPKRQFRGKDLCWILACCRSFLETMKETSVNRKLKRSTTFLRFSGGSHVSRRFGRSRSVYLNACAEFDGQRSSHWRPRG